MKDICGVILVGGKGKRFGSSKLDLIIGNEKILPKLVQELRKVCNEIILAGRKGLPVENARCVEDALEDRGPLAGIVSSMEASEASLFLVIPCDMPFLTAEIFKIYLPYIPHFDVTLSYQWGFPLGLKRTVYPAMKRSLNNNSLCLFDVIRNSDFSIKVIPREEICRAGDPDVLFASINTPEDYGFALQIMERSGRLK